MQLLLEIVRCLKIFGYLRLSPKKKKIKQKENQIFTYIYIYILFISIEMPIPNETLEAF